MGSMTRLPLTLADDCFRTDRPRLTHAQAIDLLRTRIRAQTEVERVALASASGRIVADDVWAPRPVPAQTNAAVDGYAFAAAGYDQASGSTLDIAGRAAAGHPFIGTAPLGAAVRIFTGAVLPEGTDTCVMQEDCALAGDGERITIPAGLKPGANARRAGEDVRQGEHIVKDGDVLRPQDVAALVSIGMTDIGVRRKLRVGILSSGDEVVASGGTLGVGQVHDTNRPLLSGLVHTAGADVVDLGVVPDRRDAVEGLLRDAALRCDVILTSGGASGGDEDHLAPALASIGKRHLWQIAVKPGRPMSFGQIGDTVVLGLPGNPVAVFVCFLLYGWPLLRRRGGAAWPEPPRFPLPTTFAFAGRKVGRREYWRGILATRPDGTLAVDKFPRDGSGLISGLRAADGLIEIAESTGDIAVGDIVSFIPFSAYGIVR